LFIAFSASAQQEPSTSFYWNNYSYFNPAMSGVVNQYEANATWRNQWNKVNGAPNTLFVNYGMNLADKHGLGMNYRYETIGFSNVHEVKVNYNYQLKLDNNRKLALGTAVGFQNYRMNPEWVLPTTVYDPALPTGYSSTALHLDLGVAYYGDVITAGIGVTQLPITRNSTSSNGVLVYTSTPHLFGNFRAEKDLSFLTIILETQMRTDLVKYSQDFNVGLNWNNILEGGVGYRTSDAIIFNLTGIIAKNYRIGYSYDLSTNKLSNVSRGTHEVTLGWRLPN